MEKAKVAPSTCVKADVYGQAHILATSMPTPHRLHHLLKTVILATSISL